MCLAATPHGTIRRALVLLALASTLVSAAGVRAAEGAGAASPDAETAAEPAYRVSIDAPAELVATLARNVGLVRWKGYADMTAELMDRLVRDAYDEAWQAAAAEGYFSAGVDITVDRSVKPPAVTLKVAPGAPTRVTAVAIDVVGPASEDAARGAPAIAKIREDWGLPRGDVFRQTAWAIAKERALVSLRGSPYASAKIATSEAAIDPEARSASLALGLESGPAFHFGELAIEGLSKYPPSIVRNFNTIPRGEPYSDAALEQLIRRLNATGYFSSVQATIDPDPAQAADATVRMAVIEAPPRGLEGGLGYSTDVRYTARASYRDVNVDGRGLQMYVEGQLDGDIQSGSLRFVQPANAAHWIGTWSTGYRHTDIEGLVTQTASFGTRWHTVQEPRQRAVSATYYLDDQHPDGAPSQRSHALYVEGEQYLREVDDLLSPTRGYMASVQLGGGIPGVSTRGFGRAIGRFAAWIPVDRVTGLTLRADAGAVLAPTRTGIPSPLLFRTGGDTTVRGYAFESLGVAEGSATVPGRYYAVGSVETVRWLGDSWGLAAFVDAGDACDALQDFQINVGYGTGLRLRTPLGPFRLDVAYGQQSREVRLHFSVGLSF